MPDNLLQREAALIEFLQAALPGLAIVSTNQNFAESRSAALPRVPGVVVRLVESNSREGLVWGVEIPVSPAGSESARRNSVYTTYNMLLEALHGQSTWRSLGGKMRSVRNGYAVWEESLAEAWPASRRGAVLMDTCIQVATTTAELAMGGSELGSLELESGPVATDKPLLIAGGGKVAFLGMLASDHASHPLLEPSPRAFPSGSVVLQAVGYLALPSLVNAASFENAEGTCAVGQTILDAAFHSAVLAPPQGRVTLQSNHCTEAVFAEFTVWIDGNGLCAPRLLGLPDGRVLEVVLQSIHHESHGAGSHGALTLECLSRSLSTLSQYPE